MITIRSKAEKKHEKGIWYVAIVRNSNGSYDFYTAENQKSFREFVKRNKLEIVVEQKGLTEKEMDKILGYTLIPTDDGFLRNDNAIKTGSEHLANLTIRLNQDRDLNPKTEFEKLYQDIRES